MRKERNSIFIIITTGQWLSLNSGHDLHTSQENEVESLSLRSSDERAKSVHLADEVGIESTLYTRLVQRFGYDCAQ